MVSNTSVVEILCCGCGEKYLGNENTVAMLERTPQSWGSYDERYPMLNKVSWCARIGARAIQTNVF